MIDIIREKGRWEAELMKQRAIEAALKNHQMALGIADKFRDEGERNRFIENMAGALASLIPQHGAKLKTIEAVSARGKRGGVRVRNRKKRR